MKKTIKILFAILLVSTLVLTLTACNSEPCEHEWQLYSEIPATCTEPGGRDYECTKCGLIRHEVISQLAHTPVNMEGQPATCKDTGLEGGVKCSVCGKILTQPEVTALVSHNFEETVTPATCDTEGSIVRKCTICGEEYVQVIPVAHNWDSGVVTVEATCMQIGERTYTCTICGETKTNIIAMGDHDYGDLIPAVDPDMDNDGHIAYFQCSICDKLFDEMYNEITLEDLGIPSLSHRRIAVTATHATVTGADGNALVARAPIGTEVSFKVVAEFGYAIASVTVEGEVVTADDNGIYTLTVAEGTTAVAIAVTTEIVPVSLRLTFTLAQELPSYVSVWYTGGVLDAYNWPSGTDALEAKKLEGNTYYVDVDNFYVDNPEHLKYILALGYNASSGLSSLGLNWNYKSTETNTTDGTFTVNGSTTIDLGTHHFTNIPGDPSLYEDVDVTFALEFDAMLDSKYVVYLVGGFGEQDGAYWWEKGPIKMEATDSGRTKFTGTATLKKLNLGVDVEFQVILWEGELKSGDNIYDGKSYGGTYGEYGSNAKVTLPANPTGEVWLFDSPLSSVKEVTFTLKFSGALPDMYKVWLIGEMNNWNEGNAYLMKSSDRINFSITVPVTAYKSYQFKVTITKTDTFGWENEQYLNATNGTSNGNGLINVTGPGEFALFKSALAPLANTVKVTLTVQFASAVGSNWHIWMYGEMTQWGSKTAEFTSSDRITWSFTAEVAPGNTQKFLVIALTSGTPGSNWNNKYGQNGAKGAGSDATITYPSTLKDGDTVQLFGATKLVLPS